MEDTVFLRIPIKERRRWLKGPGTNRKDRASTNLKPPCRKRVYLRVVAAVKLTRKK